MVCGLGHHFDHFYHNNNKQSKIRLQGRIRKFLHLTVPCIFQIFTPEFTKKQNDKKTNKQNKKKIKKKKHENEKNGHIPSASLGPTILGRNAILLNFPDKMYGSNSFIFTQRERFLLWIIFSFSLIT